MKYKISVRTADTLPKLNELSALVLFVEKTDNKNKLKEFESERNIKLPALSAKAFLDDAQNKFEFWGNSGERVIVFKYDLNELSVDFFRDKLASVVQLLLPGIENLVVDLLRANKFKRVLSLEYCLRSAVEGVLLGNYDFTVYKSEKKKSEKLTVTVVNRDIQISKKAAAQAKKVIEGVYFARDLVNEPAITLTPQEFVRRVRRKFAGTRVKVTAMNQAVLKKNNMNAILSVGRGSDNPPVLLRLEYKPTRPKGKIALVGKGVTYDSGGYSIKSTEGMVDMKADMAGAAAVIGTFVAADKLRLSKHLIGVIPLVENMINGKSFKPGDIISTTSGKTIEVKNTDAEGRLILADALEYACKQKPDTVIDFATLTGACVVALGEFAAGMFSKNDNLLKKLKSAGDKTYELVWSLPFMDVYSKLLKSDIADISNLGPRWGGAITAAKFLESFVDENIAYAHLDIAGPAMKNQLSAYTKKWATGFGVRLMTEFLND